MTHNPEIRAYDPETGEKIGVVPLPWNVSVQPITYRVEGRQFRCVPIGGASFPGQFVALALPEPVVSEP